MSHSGQMMTLGEMAEREKIVAWLRQMATRRETKEHHAPEPEPSEKIAARARAEERAKIVAWLRGVAPDVYRHELAQRIEEGHHT